MAKTIEEIILHIKDNAAIYGITLYEGASEDEIMYFESASGIRIPEDIRIFYLFCNGFESEEDMFRIIPLEEIAENLRSESKLCLNTSDFDIAEYMTYCDMWSVSVNTGSYSIYNETNKKIALTNSFAVFLEVFLKGGVFDGLYDWLEQIKASK